MNERLDQARRLGRRIEAAWRREDVEAQLAHLHVRLRRRTLRRAFFAPVAGIAIAAAITVTIMNLRGSSTPSETVQPVSVMPDVTVDRSQHELEAAPVAPPSPRATEEPALPSGVMSLGDGSVVTPLGKDSRLLAREVSETNVVVALTGGSARFDVPDRRARRFRADLGSLALETHGAAFRVRVTRRQIEVVAERGEVSARVGRERHVLAAGDTRTFPLVVPQDTAPVDRDEPIAPPAPSNVWRDHAVRGDYAAAWVAFESTASPIDSMEDLLLAGDVARLSDHPAAAVSPLSRAVALHPADPRAPLAAFTLGRVHLEDLGAPREAAQAFARARELSPGGPLAEDALAREVEAWSRAGETETAGALARTYLQRYPRGHRVHAVRRFGDVEAP
jgi:transmembrane sensor